MMFGDCALPSNMYSPVISTSPMALTEFSTTGPVEVIVTKAMASRKRKLEWNCVGGAVVNDLAIDHSRSLSALVGHDGVDRQPCRTGILNIDAAVVGRGRQLQALARRLRSGS